MTEQLQQWFDMPPTLPPLSMATDRDTLVQAITDMHTALRGSPLQGKLLRTIDDTTLSKGEFLSFHAWEVTNHAKQHHPRLVKEARQLIAKDGPKFTGSVNNAIGGSVKMGKVEAAMAMLGQFTLGRPMSDLNEEETGIMRMVTRLQAKGICDTHDVLFISRCFGWNDGQCQMQSNGMDGELERDAWAATEHILSRTLKRPTDAIGDFMQQMTQLMGLFPETHPVVADIRAEMNVGNQWLLPSDAIQSSNLTNDYLDQRGLIIGPFLESEDVCFFNGEGSLITIARPGAGKTQCHVLPNLRRYPGPAIVLDIKGECLEETGLVRQNQFGNVYVFGPSMEGSNSYNPLDAVRRDDRYIWADASILASTLIIDDGRQERGWIVQARNLLTLLVSWACKQDDNASMADVMDLIAGMGLDDLFETLTHASAKGVFPREMLRSANTFAKFKNSRNDGQWNGYVGGMQEQLDAWNGHAVESITQSSDWKPDVFNEGSVTLFLNFALDEVSVYASVIRAILGQHFKQLVNSRQGYDTSTLPILVMLDELPRLGEMEAIKEALEFGRDRGIRLWMFAQNEAQIRDAYGADVGSGMIESCEARIYMRPASKTAEALSKQLGETIGVLDSRGKPLASPQELEGPDYKHLQIAMITGNYPARLGKLMYKDMGWPE